jgi:prepilin-type N-terminal cleavage/methylation domain-containing protein
MICPDEKTRGSTLLEVLIATVILSVLAFGMNSLIRVGSVARNGSAERQLERLAYQAMERIAGDLATAGRDTIEFDTYEIASLSYRHCLGAVDGVTQWTDSRVIEWQADPEDPVDGVDNNHNGLIDEGMVVLRVDVDESDESSTVLVRGVQRYLEGEIPNGTDDNGNGLIDEPGLSVVREGNLLRVRLSLARSGPDSRRIIRTLESVVALRN